MPVRTDGQYKQKDENSEKASKKEMNNSVIEMKSVFDWPISGLDMAEERIHEPEDVSIETFKIRSKENKDWRKRNGRKYQELWGNCKRHNVCVI